MHTFAFITLMAFVFSIPWENSFFIDGFGTISRAMGFIAFFFSVAAIVINRLFRPPNIYQYAVLLFVLWAMLSSIWSLYDEGSFSRVFTYLQLFLLVCIVWMLVDTQNKMLWLYISYVAGSFVSVLSTYYSYISGIEVTYLRYSAKGFDPNEIAVILAISVPLAWYLSFNTKFIFISWIYRIYIPLVYLAIALTGSRTGLAAAGISFFYLIVTLGRTGVFTKIIFAVAIIASINFVALYIPESTLNRLASLADEASSGTLHGRTIIWNMGFEMWMKHPVFGIGSGAFEAVVGGSAHNTPLLILVELGIIGAAFFGFIIFTVLRYLMKMQSQDKKMFLFILLILASGLMTLSWDIRKPMWLITCMLVCHYYLYKNTDSETKKNDKSQKENFGTNRYPILRAKYK